MIRRVAIALLVLLGIAAGWYFYGRDAARPMEKEKAPAAKSRRGFDSSRPTPVGVDTARRGDIDLHLTGLGTVTPLKTVTVRARVEGELLRVAFTEGQHVKEGDLLAEIDPRPFQVQLMQAEGQMARDQALLANARIDLERYQGLFRQDSIARQEVDTQAALVRQYEGAIQADRAQVRNARLQLDYARINAPISGRLGLRLVDPGNVVRPGDANGIVVITQLRPISVIFSIPQDDLPQVLRQKGRTLPVEAWDRANRTRLATGTLITVDNQIDPATGTVKLKAEFANQDGGLFPNQFVNVRMLVETRRDVLTVSSAALLRGSQGQFVYVVRADSTVSVRPVRTGPVESGRIVVESGLEAGERVVVDGLDRLREGAKVEVGERR